MTAQLKTKHKLSGVLCWEAMFLSTNWERQVTLLCFFSLHFWQFVVIYWRKRDMLTIALLSLPAFLALSCRIELKSLAKQGLIVPLWKRNGNMKWRIELSVESKVWLLYTLIDCTEMVWNVSHWCVPGVHDLSYCGWALLHQSLVRCLSVISPYS